MNPVRPGDVSALEHEFLLGAASEMYKKVRVLRVRGKHRAGADGAPDSQLIEALVSFGNTLWIPDAMVFDFTGLAYEGGTMLRRALSPVEPSLEEGFPLYVAVAPERRAAFAEALPADALVASVDDAVAKIRTAGPWALR